MPFSLRNRYSTWWKWILWLVLAWGTRRERRSWQFSNFFQSFRGVLSTRSFLTVVFDTSSHFLRMFHRSWRPHCGKYGSNWSLWTGVTASSVAKDWLSLRWSFYWLRWAVCHWQTLLGKPFLSLAGLEEKEDFSSSEDGLGGDYIVVIFWNNRRCHWKRPNRKNQKSVKEREYMMRNGIQYIEEWKHSVKYSKVASSFRPSPVKPLNKQQDKAQTHSMKLQFLKHTPSLPYLEYTYRTVWMESGRMLNMYQTWMKCIKSKLLISAKWSFNDDAKVRLMNIWQYNGKLYFDKYFNLKINPYDIWVVQNSLNFQLVAQ